MSERSPNLTGAAFGLGAAALFGASAPLAKLLLVRCGPLLLSALLYLGAAVALYAMKAIGNRSDAPREARLQRSDWRPLREQYRHPHVHAELVHDHMHVHDEHHADHAAAVAEPHSHVHRHAPLVHEHAHAPDAHHRHTHS